MSYQNTEITTESIKTESVICWIELQCHAREAIRGWAFRVGGSGVSKNMDWQYGYPSEDEAKATASAVLEQLLESDLRASEKKLAASRSLLDQVKAQSKKHPVASDRIFQ